MLMRQPPRLSDLSLGFVSLVTHIDNRRSGVAVGLVHDERNVHSWYVHKEEILVLHVHR